MECCSPKRERVDWQASSYVMIFVKCGWSKEKMVMMMEESFGSSEMVFEQKENGKVRLKESFIEVRRSEEQGTFSVCLHQNTLQQTPESCYPVSRAEI